MIGPTLAAFMLADPLTAFAHLRDDVEALAGDDRIADDTLAELSDIERALSQCAQRFQDRVYRRQGRSPSGDPLPPATEYRRDGSRRPARDQIARDLVDDHVVPVSASAHD